MTASSNLLRVPADEAVRRLILDRAACFRRANEHPRRRARVAEARRDLELVLEHLASRFCECAFIGKPLDARSVAVVEEAASVFTLDLRGKAAAPSFGVVAAGLLRALGARALAEAESERAAGSAWDELIAFFTLVEGEASEQLAAFRPHAGDELSVERARRAIESAALSLELETEVETEQKFLLRSLPPIAEESPSVHILQGYVPGKRLHERLRRISSDDATRWIRTVKLGAGIQRVEIEEDTSEAIFDRMWPLTSGRRIEKRRYSVDDGGYTWVIDRFLDRELVLAEVELPTLGLSPAIPDWMAPYLVRDVTSDPAFVNANLAS